MNPLIPHTSWERKKKQDFQRVHQPFQSAVNDGQGKGYDFDSFTQDLFSSLYQVDPQFPDNSTTGAAWAKKALDELNSLPDFKNIRQRGTICDSLQSGLGASILARHFADSLPKMEEPNPDDLRDQVKGLEDLMSETTDPTKVDRITKRIGDINGKQPRSEQAWQEMTDNLDASAIRQAFRRAFAEVQEKIDQIDEAANAFGFGTDPGQDGYTDPKTKIAIAKEVLQNQKLMEIAKLAGRFRREARKVQANKKQPGPDELVDIEIGNDLGRLLPSELMKLTDETLELDFMRRYLERAQFQYRMEDNVQESKGPIIVCIDNSGSMMGAREIWSKAIALAMCQIAIDQKRPFELIHFHSEVARKDYFSMSNGGFDPQKLLESISFFSNGGTNFVPPLNQAIDDTKNGTEKGLKGADIIFITDGCCSIGEKMVEQFRQELKKYGIRLYYVLLEAKDTYNELGQFSTEVLTIPDMVQSEKADAGVKEIIFNI